ncbi:MAG: LPS assembly lipoprotein LptE [Phycisphaerae bacterium]
MTIRLNIAWMLPAAAATLAGLVGGCSSDPEQGYTLQTPYRDGISTIAVPIWNRGKDVYRREVEFRLTEAIQKRIAANTPYAIASRSQADTLLEGTIDRIDQRVLFYNPDNSQPREQEIRMEVSFTWTDLRTGKILVRRSGYAVTARYIQPPDFNEDFFLGSEAVFDKLARQVVNLMEKPWGTPTSAPTTEMAAPSGSAPGEGLGTGE